MILKIIIRNLYKIIMLLYLLLFSRLFELCFQIHNFNYLVIITLYILSIILYWFYFEVLKRFILKFIFIALILIVFFILYLCNLFNPITIIFNNFLFIRSRYLQSLFIDFNLLIPFIVIIIPCIISFIFSLKDKVTFITLIFTLPFMYLFWYNNFSIKIYTSIYIILVCFDLGINIYFSSLRKAKINNFKFSIPQRNIILYIAIMAALVVSFTSFAGEVFGTKSIEQFNNDRMKAIIDTADSIENTYGLYTSGYGNNSSILGGPININYNLALKVKSSRPMYLRGNVLDYYNGSGWSSTLDEYQMFYNNSINKAGKTAVIEISPQTLKTSTFLSPMNTVNIVSKGNNIMYNASNIFIIGNKSTVISDYSAIYALTEDDNFSNDALYGKEVTEKYKKYLQLPDNITPETYDLVKAMIKDCKSNADKISKINKYLLENYKYSLQVNIVPKDKEFLDYFLFKEKKGYCTYFATASTIFARIAGVPAKYVEGFSMDDNKDSSGVYLVGNNRAHAWTEILTSPVLDSWGILDCTPDFSDSKEQYKLIMPKVNIKTINTVEGESKTGKNDSVIKVPKINISFISIIWVMVITLSLYVSGVFIVKLHRWIKNKNKILYCNGVIAIYYYSKKRLSTIEIKWNDSVSDEEGALALEDELLREHFINIVKVFYEEYYGGKINDSFNKLEFYNYIEGYVKKNSNLFKYYYNKLK